MDILLCLWHYFFMSAEAIEFRDASSQEIGAIALVIARAHAYRDGIPLPTATGDSQTLGLQEYLHEYMGRPDVWAYAAVSPEGVVGFASGYPHTDEETPATTADTEYLSFLMVEPDCWNMRIASRLLDIVADRARRAGRSRVMLWTRDEDNNHARAVYEHKGYVPSGISRESRHGRQVQYQLDL